MHTVGKKGTVTDMTFFEIKKGNDSVTLIEPSKYPEKLSSLFYGVSMAEYAILVVEKIDSFLGETIVMIDSLGIDKGWIVLRNYIQPEQLKPLLVFHRYIMQLIGQILFRVRYQSLSRTYTVHRSWESRKRLLRNS